MKRHRVWLSGLAALAALPAAAKVDDPNDLVEGRWYATEVIIFARTEPADPGPEQLDWEGGRTWPAKARAFTDSRPWRIASLDPLTRACLEFPRLDLAPTTTTPAQCPEAELSDGEAAQSWPGAEADPPAGVERLQLGEREAAAARMEQTSSLPREGAPQQLDRGRDDVDPGMAPGASAEPWSDDLPPVDGRSEGMAPVACPSTPQPDASTLSGTAPLEPIALRPPPAIEPSLAPHPLLGLLRAAARQQAAWRRDSYRWLPEGTHSLKTQTRRIRNAQGLNVVWHGRWMQPVPSRSAGEPLMLDLPATADHGRVSGTLAVTLGRFLHFNAMLWLEEPDNGRDGLVPFKQLSEARTMRLGELHYLDHPRLGVLVRISRVPPSPALVRALQAWETAANG